MLCQRNRAPGHIDKQDLVAARRSRTTVSVTHGPSQHHRRASGPWFKQATQRHAVECGINRIKRHRGIATRYDKLAVRYQAVLTIAVITEWL